MILTRKSKHLLFLGVLVLGIGSAAGFFFWRSHVMAVQEKRNYEDAQKLLKEERPKEALTIIKNTKATLPPEKAEKWVPMEIKALEQSRNIHRLLYMYDRYPDEVKKQEKASLLVARALQETLKTDEYTKLRKFWKKHEKTPEDWCLLDADDLILQGKPDEAVKLLSSKSFKGRADCGRLVKLATLTAQDNLEGAWELLGKAYSADPRNTDVRSFRGQILEQEGQLPEARIEYVAALVSDPKNPLMRDQLAEFYRRQSNYTLALQTWIEGLKEPSPEYFWIKSLFWSKVSHRLVLPAQVPAYPPSEMVQLIMIMKDIKEGDFWDDKAVQSDVNLQKLALSRQEVFWLKLMQAFKDKAEVRAYQLLDANRFREGSYHPELEQALQTVLIYRKFNVVVKKKYRTTMKIPASRIRHQLFEQLDSFTGKDQGIEGSYSVPRDLDALLRSKDAFIATFLAAGWLEAALELYKPELVPETYPDWFAYGMTQALRYNRGNTAAYNYARIQKPTPALELLIAEILLADNRPDLAIPKLKSLAQDNSDIAFRASWLLGLSALYKGDFGEAVRVVNEHGYLSSSVTGKEILAKSSLGQGNAEDAERIYSSIIHYSYEAKVFLARRAFARKDFASARKYTEELIVLFPDMMEFRENLKRIEWEEKNAAP